MKIKKKKIIIKIAKVLLILLLPTLSTFFLFKPFKHMDIVFDPKISLHISREEINQNLSTEIIAELLQTELNLNRYKICLQNDGVLDIQKLPLMVRQRLEENPELGKIWIDFNQGKKGGATSTNRLTTRPGEKDCETIQGDIDGISYETDNATIFIAMNNLAIKISDRSREDGNTNDPMEGDPSKLFVTFTTEEVGDLEFVFNLSNMKIFIKNDPVSMAVQWFLLFLTWGTFILFIRGLHRFIIGEK